MYDVSTYENIPLSFYQRDDVVKISKELIGMILFHQLNDGLVGGRIVETEAYNGRNDKACHAFNKRTPRTEVMYEDGGRAYIYLCYGIHHLFNIVTNSEGKADAVLIRAIEPIFGIEIMRRLAGKSVDEQRLASGPGLVGKAMSFDTKLNGSPLDQRIWLGKPRNVPSIDVVAGKRIGVDYAEEDADLPWRFMLKDSLYVSKK